MSEAALYGAPRRHVESEGFLIDEKLAWPVGPELSVVRQAAAALEMVGEALQRRCPDALVLTGDRFETHSAATAATLARIPIVHLHGGEETEGAFDNAFRHAITKMAHLHLVSHVDHAARVLSMGEDPAAIHVVGAPGLDNLARLDLPGRDELEQVLAIKLEAPVVIVTLHPATLGADPEREAAAVIGAMNEVDATYVITLPNADPGSAITRRMLRAASETPRRCAAELLGERRYWGLMRVADAILGNSSSALVEAPALGLPAVNVGDRQRGRLRGANVVDVPAEPGAVAAALRTAIAPQFRARVRASSSPYGDGSSAQRIVEILSRWIPPRPPLKRFHMHEGPA